MPVGCRQHRRRYGSRVRRLGQRSRGVCDRAWRAGAADRIILEEDQREAGRGDGNLTCVGALIAVYGRDIQGALEAAIDFVGRPKRLVFSNCEKAEHTVQ